MVGGDYQNPAEFAKTAAFTDDGGQTWQLAAQLPAGYRSGVAWSRNGRALAAVGTSGTDSPLTVDALGLRLTRKTLTR